jgi:UDP-N-acetylmuramoyl-tripeptide--D-alanyl-D-alanine ligase
MTPLSIDEIVEATDAVVHGSLPGSMRVDGIERDSRHVQPGQLFIAIRGERHDGHAFIDQAAANGAAGALVSRQWAAANPDPPLPLLVVDEPVSALQRLAAARRAMRGDELTVVGVTGSVGKTSTKEVIASILSSRYSTYRSPGNLNNEIGLPLSLLDITADTEVAVLEMGGAYAFSELALLSNIAKPKIGVVTNVYPVHLERMGTIEAIAATKAELVAALPENGTAVLNGDDARVRAMAAQTRAHVITYGLDSGNEIRADQIRAEALEGTTFRVHIDGEPFHVKVPLVGGHAVDLALAGIAVGHAMGMHVSEMMVGLNDPAIQVRLLVIPGPRGSQIIDDTYNASTPSVLSALGLLEQMKPERAIAVLGDMRELGSLAEEEHRVVGRRAAQVADIVVAYGDLARYIAEEAAVVTPDDVDGRPPRVATFALEERQELIDFLSGELREGDVALLKGSRGLEMEEMVAALRDDAGQVEDSHHNDTTTQ